MTYRRFMRLISILLAAVMTIQVIPANAVAAITAENTPAALDINDSNKSEEMISVGNKSFKIVGEIEALRDENNKHFRLEDGTNIAVSYNNPVHYRDSTGKWKEINNKLTLTQDIDGRKVYKSNNTVTPASFSANLEDGELLTTSVDDVSVTMRILDSSQSKSVDSKVTVRSSVSLESPSTETSVRFNRSTEACILEESTNVLALKADSDETSYENAEALQLKDYETSVLYPDVYPDTDIQYTAYSYNIKEQIIVKKPQKSYRYDFMLELDGLSAILNEDGSISLTDDKNNQKYYIPAPYMEDANGVCSTAVVYALAKVAGGVKLTVIADKKWLNANDRAFPVAIDPTLQMVISQKTENDSSLYSTYVKEGSPSETLFGCRKLYFGYSSLSDVKKQYGYLHFSQMPTVPSGSIVTMAKLNLFMCSYSQINCTEMPLNVYEVTDVKPSTASNYYDWFSRISWNEKPEFNTANAIDYAMTSASVDDTYLSWEITELVKKWYDEDTENRTIAIVPSDSAAYSSSYCASATFYAYDPSYGPNLIVHYRSSVGLEPYYTYNTIAAGNAGTAYIGNESGQLKVAVPLAGYSSTINPVSVNLIYNSDYFTSSSAYKPPLSLGLDMAVGHGWTLDIIQKMEDITLSGIEYKKYTDGDGTVHYFLPKEGDSDYFYDEDGLGLKVQETSSNNYVMSDDHGNSWTFTNRFLTNIADANGNQILINYSNGRIISIQQKNNGNGAITVASFTYSSSSNALTAITDAAENIYYLVYSNTTGNLIDIEKNNMTIARYCYDGRRITRMVDMESYRAIEFTYSNKKISSYYEVIGVTVNDITGAHVNVNYLNSSKTIYCDYGNDRVYNSDDDILTHYLFDYAGRTVNAYTTDVAGNILGAENAVYTGIGDVNKKNNRTQHYSSIGVAAQHLMGNPGIEDTASYLWTLANTSVATTKPRTGLRSIKGTLGSSTQSALRRVGTISANTSYTFSAYVNTAGVTNFSNTGIYLRVRDQSTNEIWDSLPINYRTSNEVDDGWVRISVSFTAESGGDHIVGIYCDGGSGTFYADDFQLEQGVSVSNYNLLENGDMELSDYGWTYESSASSYTGLGVAGSNHSIIITGNPLDTTTTHAYQEVKVNLPSSETYVLSGWVGAKSVAGDERKKCGLKAVIYYSDSQTEEHYASFNSDISTWQFLSYSIVPKKAGKIVSKIRVICAYEGNANRAYFDNISLVRESVQTMRYDDDGNLESVVTPGLNKDVNTYEGGNLIQSVTGGYGTYEYEYNNTYKHRLNSIKGYYLTQTMGYSDGKGNVTSTTLSDNREVISATLKSGATYSNSGNLQTSYTDANVVTTAYSYSDDNSIVYGIPNIITTENGTQTVREIDSDGRITKVYIPSTASVSYTYNDGDLTKITRTDTASGKSTNYTLSYDSFGNLTTAKAGNNVLATYTYGSKNGLIESMRYGNDPDSDPSIDYEYDRFGRLKTKEYDNGRLLTYSYSGDGPLARIKENLSGSVNFLYLSLDQLGRLESIRRQNGTDTVLHASTRYNANNQITGQSWTVGRGTDAKTYTESYLYNTADGLLTGITTATNEDLTLNRDGLRRLSSITGGKYTKRYTYRNESETRTTNQVESLSYTDLVTPLTYRYTYNSMGYISAITDPIAGNREYAYDSQGQMLHETINGTTYTYTYDKVGNILTSNNHSGAHTYVYNHGSWKDLLTKYDGVEIIYDGIGNPLSYYNGREFAFTWENGRELKTAVSENHTTTYEYDHINGTRLSKTVDGVKYEYYYSGDQLLRMTIGSGRIVDFFYDQIGQPYAMKYNGNVYYYILNAQGDVVKLISATGESYGIYSYDAWGNLLYVTNNDVMAVNPLRYRGYVYDTETGFYYVSSRYYDPEIGRWINADSQLNTSLGVLGCNMFAYCLNNPVNKVDYGGNKPGDLFDTMDEAAKDAAEYLGELTWENTWEYSTAIYTVNTTIKTYETVTKTHRFLWWMWTTTSTKTVRTKVTKYTYKAVKTDKKNNSVGVPNAPLFKKRVAALHTHPMGSWAGITRFSDADKKWADYYKIPLYVHGPNGELRKYDPATGEDILIYSDLPISPKTPWLE